MKLHRDAETRSTVDLKKTGAHPYAEHPSTEVILYYFALGDEDPWPWFPGEDVPACVRGHIESGGIVCGHNAAFEAAIDEHIMGPRHGFPIPKPEQLDCTMARCAVQSLPLDLARACKALNLPYQKDDAGHRLMLRMCKPRKPKKGEAPGIYWIETPADIARLGEYCASDIKAERALDRMLAPLSPEERAVWLLDWRMNNRGVAIDTAFVTTAKAFAERATERMQKRMAEATGGLVTSTNQIDRLKDFAKQHGVEFRVDTKTRRNGEEYEAEAADKEALEDLLAGDLPAPVRAAFTIRLDAAKSSVKKLDKFKSQQCRDGRAKNTLQYHAAGPGRWAGRGIQLQNLVRAGVEVIRDPVTGKKIGGGWDEAYRDMRELDDEVFELVWGSPLDTISRMMRGAVIAPPGKKLYFADYSQVEARGSAYAAGQHDLVELFANDGKVYEEMAAFIFGKSVEEVIHLHKSKEDIIPRFVGKEAILGCGYGIGAAAFKKNCKKKGKVILPEATAAKAVYGWRDKNFKIVEFWRELEDAARSAVESRNGSVFRAGPFSYRVKGRWLQCRLPSGRIIWYRRPSLKPDRRDVEQCDTGESVPRYRWKIHYWGVNGDTKQWEEETTWGGKLLENCVQGMCRDFLAGAMQRHERAGYTPILSVHDEAISETDADFGNVDEFVLIMTELPEWAKGFPLKAEGGDGVRYAKA